MTDEGPVVTPRGIGPFGVRLGAPITLAKVSRVTGRSIEDLLASVTMDSSGRRNLQLWTGGGTLRLVMANDGQPWGALQV